MKPIKKKSLILNGDTLPHFIAIDPSPNGTSIVKFVRNGLTQFWFCTTVKKWKKEYPLDAIMIEKVGRGDDNGRVERIITIRDFVLKILSPYNQNNLYHQLYVGMEDYVWSVPPKASGGLYQIGELGGVLRVALWEHGYRTRLYDPVSVKLAMTAKGNATKEEMIQFGFEHLSKCSNPYVIRSIRNLPIEYQEGVMDAVGVAFLLMLEIELRRGEVSLKSLPENVIRVINRVTKANPNCLIDTPFLSRIQ